MRLEDFLRAPAEELGLGWLGHLSASSISMFMRCPEQFRQRYVLGLKEAPGAALVLGRGFHFAQEFNFRHKLQSGEDASVANVQEAYHHGWDMELEKFGGVSEIKWDSEKPDTLREKGEKLAVQYRVAVAPPLQPIAVEQEFSVVLRDVPVPVIGFIDLRARREIESSVLEAATVAGRPATIDYKTAKSVQRALKPEWLLQARLYQSVTRERVEYHVATKTKDPKIVTPADAEQLAIEPSDTAIRLTSTLVARVARQIAWHYAEFGPDVAWPGAITHPWACGFCGFRPSCHWWAT